MSEATTLHRFGTGERAVAVALPHDLEAMLDDWSGLRRKMVRDVPAEFTRDEWAYLVNFVAPCELRKAFTDAFGPAVDDKPDPPTSLLRPRGPVALWLPNNVSLLGPLTMVLVGLTGSPLWIKAGSRSDDLCGALIRWALRHLDDGPLRTWLRDRVVVEQLPRTDPAHATRSAEAAVRIVFGSDTGAAAIGALPSSPAAPFFAFVDKKSQAWAEPAALDDDALRTLIAVFAIYGRAGCTSPARLVLIDGTPEDCTRTTERLAPLLPQVTPGDVPMHRASENVMAAQLARAAGWRVRQVPRHAAVLLTAGLLTAGPLTAGDTPLADLPAVPPGLLSLPVVSASLQEAAANLPANAQTVGHLVRDPGDERWLKALATTPACRFVPVGKMHHFGPVWDGIAWWRQLLQQTELLG